MDITCFCSSTTPDYKDKTETSNIPFKPLKHSDFKNLILKILEVADESQEDTSKILRITFLKSGRFRDQNDI